MSNGSVNVQEALHESPVVVAQTQSAEKIVCCADGNVSLRGLTTESTRVKGFGDEQSFGGRAASSLLKSVLSRSTHPSGRR